MCIGNRKTATITIRNVYTTIAPSSATGYLVLLFISVSIILLGITLLPEIFIYETDFTDSVMVILDDGNVQGVTKISWGTWRACFATINSNIPSCTKDEWISNPYNFIIDNGVQASVQKLWNQVLFLQLVGLIFAVFLVFVLWVRMYCLARKSRRYNRDSVASLTRGVAHREPKRERVCNLSNFLTFLLWVWVTIVVIGNGVVLKSIQNEMQSLGEGITTKPALGFWLPVAADGFSLVAAALFIILIRTTVYKSQVATISTKSLI